MDEDLVVWDNSLTVGFDLLDDQHKKLVAMINELIEGCKKGEAEAQAAILQTFEKVVDYTKTHFTEEEKYLAQVAYPDLEAQKKMHHQFLFEIVNLITEVDSGKTAPITMAGFLKDWLLNHIAKADKQYLPYMKKIGRKGINTFLT